MFTRRDCPIKMYYLNEGAGWSRLYADFGSGELQFPISYITDEFQTMTEILCKMHPDWGYRHDKRSNVKFAEDESDFAMSASWCFEEEPGESVWKLERTGPFDGKNCPMHLSIRHDSELYEDEHDDDDEESDLDANVRNYAFNVTWLDLCYAVSDAWTQTLKMNGLLGYFNTNTGAQLSIKQILFLKAHALKAPEYLNLEKDPDLLSFYISDINKDIDLLLFDMSNYTLPNKINSLKEQNKN